MTWRLNPFHCPKPQIKPNVNKTSCSTEPKIAKTTLRIGRSGNEQGWQARASVYAFSVVFRVITDVAAPPRKPMISPHIIT